jgi:hypothetical protein
MSDYRVSLLGSLALGVLLLVAALMPVATVAADLSADPAAYSTIKLVQEAGDGEFAVYTITMNTRDGETTLTLDKDGKSSEIAMAYEDCQALWDYLLEMDIGNLENAPLENAYPDQSLFTYSFQNGAETNTFSAYGVDFRSDKRYRAIARAILDAAAKYSP